MKLDVLAIAAHPDDIELAAAGTFIKLARLGYKIGIVDLTKGEKGTRGTSKIRLKEAKEAAKIMLVKLRKNLSLPDTEIISNRTNQLKIIKIIREYQPDIIFTHYWESSHPDHIATSYLVSEASHLAGLIKINTNQPKWRPSQIIYYHLPPFVNPSFIVDITDVYQERVKAIQCYKSQFSLSPNNQNPETYLSDPFFLQAIEAKARYYGSLIGTSFGEGFFIKNYIEIKDIVSFFKREKGPLIY